MIFSLQKLIFIIKIDSIFNKLRLKYFEKILNALLEKIALLKLELSKL